MDVQVRGLWVTKYILNTYTNIRYPFGVQFWSLTEVSNYNLTFFVLTNTASKIVSFEKWFPSLKVAKPSRNYLKNRKPLFKRYPPLYCKLNKIPLSQDITTESLKNDKNWQQLNECEPSLGYTHNPHTYVSMSSKI